MGWVIFRQIWKAVLLYAKGLEQNFFKKTYPVESAGKISEISSRGAKMSNQVS